MKRDQAWKSATADAVSWSPPKTFVMTTYEKKVPALSWLTHAVWAGRCFGTGLASVVSSAGRSQTISALERYITNSATLWVDSMPT